jgi:hypothetical protein
MAQVRRDLEQRHKHECPLEQPWMRDFDFGFTPD